MEGSEARLPEQMKFEGNLANNFKKFRQQFEIYMMATQKNKKDSVVKVAILLNLLGPKGIEIFNNLGLTDEEKKEYEEVIKAFELYVNPRRNVIYERFMFNKRKQRENEPFDQFVQDLKVLVKSCEYNNQEEDILRDRVVLGINDTWLQGKLIGLGNLTLEKAIEMGRANEITKSHIRDVQEAVKIDILRKNNKREEKKNEEKLFMCQKCGTNHGVRKCPAFGKRCNQCGCMNHFSKLCRYKNKRITVFEENECSRSGDESSFMISTIQRVKNKEVSSVEERTWYENVKINNQLSEIEVPRISNYTAEEFSPAAASLLEKNIRKCLVNSKNDVEAQRKNPSSPLYSVKTFEEFNLKADLLKGVYAMGFNTPSKIQEIALKTLLVEPPQNLIAQSQSGTGKTAAFVLAMLSRVDSSKNYPQVLCLSPTFEIAIQTGEVAANMAKFCTDIEIRFAVRGESFARGKTLTDHVIIGTPGKVLDWALKYKVFDIKKINVFVLDDANVMLATQGHQDQCLQLHKNLDHNRCQMMFFSTSYSEEAMNFAEVIVPKALIIRLKKEEEILDNIKQYYVKCLNETDKYNVITNIYSTVSIGQAIIFCQTRKTASWLSEKMTKDGHYVALISGELSVEDRIQVLDRYRTGLEKVLITTNVFSRGIDLEEVTIVVNFDLPVLEGGADYETYLFRIGCTGRFGKKGIVLNLIDSAESEKICHSIDDHFSRKMSYLNGEDYEEIEKIGS